MIDKPGIYTLSAEAYHADPCPEPSLSASIANVILQRSPAHARIQHPRLYAGYEPRDDSRFDLGTAAHALLLERDASRFVWVPHNDWRTKDAKETRDAARAEGKLPILAQYEPVLHEMARIARETVNDSELAGLFDSGQPEQTVVWQDDGAWCRARPDWLNPAQRVCLDYKTAASAAPEQFIRQLGNIGYDVSAEFYLRGLAAVGHADLTYVFLAQEVEPPYACSLISLANTYREVAQDKVERAITCWRMCMAAGRWPAYTTRIHYAEPPAWVLNEYASQQALDEGEWQ